MRRCWPPIATVEYVTGTGNPTPNPTRSLRGMNDTRSEMNRASKLALAVVLPIAVLTAAGQTAAATAPPTEPPGTDLGTPVPADFVPLVDDTGTITVEVPGSWTDVDTAPNDALPFIEASTDRQAYNDTFDVPGVTYVATPFNTDTEAAARQFGLEGGCADEVVQPYDDGVFVGSHLIYTECGGGSAEFHVIAANPANQAFTAMLRIQITGPAEQPILDGILATFNVTAEAATGSSVPGASTVTTAATPTTATATGSAFPPPTGEIPADWTRLVDDTQTIAIAVPSTWTAIDPAPGNNEDGTPLPWISATTDQALFFPAAGTADTFSVPGVIYRAFPYDADTAGRLETSDLHEICAADPVQTYDDGFFVGHIQSFNGCGGTASRVVRVSANPADGSFTADLLIQLTGQPDDAATLNGLLLSFSQADPGAAPTTTIGAAAPGTTTPGTTTTTTLVS
jgi:hypothetical protein